MDNKILLMASIQISGLIFIIYPLSAMKTKENKTIWEMKIKILKSHFSSFPHLLQNTMCKCCMLRIFMYLVIFINISTSLILQLNYEYTDRHKAIPPSNVVNGQCSQLWLTYQNLILKYAYLQIFKSLHTENQNGSVYSIIIHIAFT